MLHTKEHITSMFARWLNTQIDKRELSVRDLADLSGFTVSTIYSWMRGDTNPSPASRKRLVKALDTTLPKKLLITTPLFGNTCSRCDHYDECKRRTIQGLPIMCESITKDDLVIADMRGYMDDLLWWYDKVPEYSDLEELLKILARDNENLDLGNII